MGLGLLSWIVFGALAGWVASIVAGRNQRMGCLSNIIVGVLGAFLGGLIVELLTGSSFTFMWSWRSFAVAVVGAVLLLVVTGWGRRRER